VVTALSCTLSWVEHVPIVAITHESADSLPLIMPQSNLEWADWARHALLFDFLLHRLSSNAGQKVHEV
jgi:hypothetical protein